MRDTNTGLIKVNTAAQKVLLDTELLGQFSDGYWENSRNTSWENLDEVQVANDSSETGVYFNKVVPYGYKGYSVNNKELLSYVGDRMLSKARVANALNISEIGEGLESILESYQITNKVEKNEVITVEDLGNILNDYLTKGDFWKNRATKAIDEMVLVGGIDTVVAGLNDNSYNMKEMRKDLGAITKVLKDARIA